jgi:peptide-methionine (S)-S-oxide reductase
MVRQSEVAVFGGGCFWCTEAAFVELRGISAVTPGYAGGKAERPTYEQVCGGHTGHAEVVRVVYDPAEISYDDLLAVFFAVHDPTTLNRQGHDVGPQYRSLILWATPAQRDAATRFIRTLNESKVYDRPVVTDVKPLERFFEAEAYHRQYYRNNMDKPYCQVVINPKLAYLRQKFSSLLNPASGERAGG